MDEAQALEITVTLVPKLGGPIEIKIKNINDLKVKAELLQLLMSNRITAKGKIVKRLSS